MQSGTPDMQALPWAPLYSTSRDGQVEVTVYGVAFVWAEDRSAQNNTGLALLRVGNTHFPLWTRSLLKPFHLMALYPTLKLAYPALTPAHFAMFMTSHQGDEAQLALLQEMMAIGGLNESDLQCPACGCLRARNPQMPSPLHHPCSGKHLAHLLYMKAKNLPLDRYLQPDQEPYRLLRELLCYLLYVDELPESVDGCGMPNLGLSAVELAQLYHALIMPASKDLIRQCPDELTEILESWEEISGLMRAYPELIGGEDRLDTRLMRGERLLPSGVPVIAKTGADGLLCVGIGPNPRFADGLGLLVKLASGFNVQQLDKVIDRILSELGLATPQETTTTLPLETAFYFEVQGARQAI